MSELKPISLTEMLELMIVENKNEILKYQILERLAYRQDARGNKSEMALGSIQRKIKVMEEALADLEDFHSEELAKQKREK